MLVCSHDRCRRASHAQSMEMSRVRPSHAGGGETRSLLQAWLSCYGKRPQTGKGWQTAQIGDAVLVAAVLGNGKRLLSQGTVLQAIGRSRTPKAGTGGFTTVDELPFFLQAEVLKPFISEELMMSTTPILFRLKRWHRWYVKYGKEECAKWES